MIVESDKIVLILEEEPDNVVKAIPMSFSDEWMIISEDEYGDYEIKTMNKVEMEVEYGEIPEPV